MCDKSTKYQLRICYDDIHAHTVTTFDHVVEHVELVDVEQDSRKMADDEHADDTQQDEGQVHLRRPLSVALPGTFVCHLIK